VARGVSAVPHPNADKLGLCMVNTGTKSRRSSAARRMRAKGLVGVFAPPGTYIPGSDFTLEFAKDPRRGIARHAVFGTRAAAIERA
jgi:phenylalanyl-tRNA synthetase beta chain